MGSSFSEKNTEHYYSIESRKLQERYSFAGEKVAASA
jgi:hypothetical protein